MLHSDALASVPRALTALVYRYRSLRSARRFAEKFFFSRDVDLRGMMKFRDPKQTLLATVAKFGRERPVSRYVSSPSSCSSLVRNIVVVARSAMRPVHAGVLLLSPECLCHRTVVPFGHWLQLSRPERRIHAPSLTRPWQVPFCRTITFHGMLQADSP